MPTFEQAYDALLTQIKTQLDVSQASLPIAWPNIDYNPSEGTSWARVTILGGESRIASIGIVGSRRYRAVGTVSIQIFVPSGQGANVGLAIADDIAAALRGVTTSGVVLMATTISPVGRDGAYYQINTSTPFRYDTIA
tara:strand:- start:732 stop:1145 length:414 start_codon:yes stop_codon:yes gene_type:complete